MKRFLTFLFLTLLTVTVGAQSLSALDQLKENPRKAYGTDYPYQQENTQLTKVPRGYKAFYISHYGRHGSRYYWNDMLYKSLDKLLTTAHEKKQLTAEGEAFYEKFEAAKAELSAGVSELTQLGWEQHQSIARTMYNRFPEVFKKGGNVFAIASLAGRCVISMSAFCQELVQCNPAIEVREQSARSTLDGVAPNDRQNPARRKFPKATPRFEKNRAQFKDVVDTLRQVVIKRVFTSTEGLQVDPHRLGGDLINLYTSLPSIGHEGMMGNIITDEEIAAQWETSNLGTYTWVFEPQYESIPILEDIIKKADAVLNGSSDHIADLRFGHDTYLGPMTVLMGINGADRDPEDPYEVKNCYQNWETCKASNMQLIFYRSKKSADILVKCLLNGCEASLPVPTTQYPYYKWSDFRDFYTARCNSIK